MTESPHRVPLVVVEPLGRGSRLHLLLATVWAAQDQRPVYVLTRADYADAHWRELTASHPTRCQVLTAPTDLGGAWTKTLNWAELRPFLDRLVAWTSTVHEPYDLAWLAIDDYPLAFLLAGWRYRRQLMPRQVAAWKYRVDYLLHPPAQWRTRLLRWLTLLSLRAWRAELVAFDERLAGRVIAGQTVRVLPDPWFGDFAPAHRAAARQRHGFASHQHVALAIGRQDDRKGFPFLLTAFPALLERHPELVLWINGPVAPLHQDALKELQQQFGRARVQHQPEFVPEADLPLVYAAADVILLPYSVRFAASSGVLSRAAASGVPVIASDHGLVGERVRRWRLGEVFPAESAPQFAAAYERLRQPGATTADAAAGRQSFAASCDLAAFAASLLRGSGGPDA